MIAGLGEDELLAKLLAQLPPAKGRGAIASAGEDDCAVVRLPGGKFWQLLKTDCVIEGVHFTSETAPEAIGWKALCRPLSDIAASGGKPEYALVTLALPGDATLDYATGIYAGIGHAAGRFGVAVVGGETARSPGPGLISICLTGKVRKGEAVTRGGGRVGDRLFVTGTLGGSFASGRHLNFTPRLAEARWLTANFRVRAMMDLSDGLAADLPRMARASGTGFVVETEWLPCAEGCTTAQAMGDGEDYELLLAVGPRQAAKLEREWRKRWPDVELTAIGELVETGVLDGLGEARGYDHFAG